MAKGVSERDERILDDLLWRLAARIPSIASRIAPDRSRSVNGSSKTYPGVILVLQLYSEPGAGHPSCRLHLW